ncbi:hypothetical protein MUY27_13990 [Mucilaginibacter sp. RS28]|uniref:YEATS-Like-Associating Three TM domain-containing protein n=1 Tax=Mucilaginibacter straminoryzae TaxID=2932774 RepID=A0A9X2B9N1_9SPHI|nr:YEATS-associated helix-containing protein [Mucilaginibacter straminoryzae]MCJ8210824.1 hypothetical protein [Mucilaginibacter straminoryzae]
MSCNINDNTSHNIILVILMVTIGGFAGYLNYFRSFPKPKLQPFNFVLSGIGAAILTPLFLHLLSSSLIKFNKDFDNINYFVFAGFCFIAGYFSDRFIGSIGEKILKEIQQTKEEVAITYDKLEKTSQEVLENQEKVDALIESESDLLNIDADNSINRFDMNESHSNKASSDFSEVMRAIVNSFEGKFKFRSVNGIAKELSQEPTIVEATLINLENQGIVRKLSTLSGNDVWALTKLGQLTLQTTD